MSPLSLTGIGLRAPHFAEFLERRSGMAWVEVHSENYFVEGGKSLHLLEEVRKDYPVSLHGVGLSLGSTDELNWQHLRKLRDLVTRVQPCLISEHLCWTSLNGHYFHDLLPLPFTEEALTHMVSRIEQVQDYLGKQILIENISSYVAFQHSTMPEWEFLKEVAEQSKCGILLDVNNVFISANNIGFDAEQYISAIPSSLVQEIHLSGFTSTSISEKKVLIDSHNKKIDAGVWDLFRRTVELIGTKPTIIEWDADLPHLETLCLEAYRAEQIMREAYVTAKLAS